MVSGTREFQHLEYATPLYDPALLANVSLGRKGLSGTNTFAYYDRHK
jgi:hypothetical protein